MNQNLTPQEHHTLRNLLLATYIAEEQIKTVVELYIKLRKGILVSINLNKCLKNGTSMQYRYMTKVAETRKLLNAYDEACEWCALNYKTND